ncbi:hypothetical protein A6C57_05485 [Fibrella sp. ES10-3-2-2]|nr:hypothetical protein A6C57_05485 [Fibrella sp. ES10-3-2-2]
MKNILSLSLLSVFLLACNQVTDTQPAPTETIPASAIQALTDQYPGAADILFKTLEKGRVWQVNFTQKSARFSAATSPQKLLIAYQLQTQAVPDSLASLVRNTVIDGGTFTNLRVQNYSWFRDGGNNGQFIFADYDWQGNRYTFRWNVTSLNSQITYTTELLPSNQLEFRTETLLDLPPSIQQSLAAQGAVFSYALVTVDAQGKKQYAVSAQQNTTYYNLTYEENGQLVAATGSANAQYYSFINQLPSAIQTYLQQTPELAGFSNSGQFSLLRKSQYAGLTTYTVNVQKGRQTWFMTFDQQGQLVQRTYLNLV